MAGSEKTVASATTPSILTNGEAATKRAVEGAKEVAAEAAKGGAEKAEAEVCGQGKSTHTCNHLSSAQAC